MMGWLDERIGLGEWRDAWKREMARPLPDRVNVFYTLGALAMSLFALLFVTGILLALHYTPSMEHAHASVRRITHDVSMGWLIRSLHHWSANLLVVVLLVHMMTAYAARAYAKPRELTWVSGGLLLFLTLGFCLTGYLLPMEQISYWATVVVTDVLRDMPLFDDSIARMVRGSDEVSDVTLSRFFLAHVSLLPGALAVFALAHLALIHRHGISGPSTGVKAFGRFLPTDIRVVTVALAVVLALAVFWPRTVDPPFDRLRTEPGTRPEWYFLGAYQLLKYLPKLGGILAMTLGSLALLSVPFVDRGPQRRRGMNSAVALAVGLAVLLSILGYVSGRAFMIFGSKITFDDMGFPQ